MKYRFDGESKRLILDQQQEFRTDSGWDESFQTYEDEVLKDIINPIENYETCRYIHKPYTSSNGIEQTDIWFYFYFVENGGYILDYTPQGLDQTTKLLADVKNSFFRLEFYKTPNNEPPNRSNRRLVFAKNLSLPVGERCFIDGLNGELYVPVFMGSNYKNKENMYLFWFEDDSVLEETLLTGTTFFMTAKFYNAADGSRIQFANKEILNGADVVEEDDLYFEVQMDRSNAPSYHYDITDYDSSGTVRGNRRGESSDPIKFYEIGASGSTVIQPTPTPTPLPTSGPTPTPTTTSILPTATPTSGGTPTISWSVGTSVTVSANNPQTNNINDITGSVTVTNGSVNVYIRSSKAFNYVNVSEASLNIGSVGTLTATAASGDTQEYSLPSTLTIPPGIYPYTLSAEITLDGGVTSGMGQSDIYTQ